MTLPHRMHRFVAVAGLILLFLAPWSLFGQESSETDNAKEEKKKEGLPLKAGRTIALSTNEGTWMSVDVSPDGSTIAFDLLGDLYTVPLEGGDATPITSGMAFDWQPTFSPDGKTVLFGSDRTGGNNLWTLDLESEKTRQITKGNGGLYVSPTWTPDGDYIIASKSDVRLGMFKLWIGHRDGGSGAELLKAPGEAKPPDNPFAGQKTVGAAVSPDGRYVWYARRNGSWDYNARLPQYQLAMYDRDTGRSYGRTSRYGSAFRPALSPDGRWLVYGSRHEDETGLRLRELNTGDERWLVYPVQRDDQESIADRDVLPGMAFTPDSRELVASYGGKIWRVPIDDGSEPIQVPFNVSVELEIGPEVAFQHTVDDTPEFTIRQIRDAVPSPDNDQLAFVALDRLYVMGYPGGEPRRLTSHDQTEAQPVWSPDGQSIAYVTWAPDGGQIFKVPADGVGPPQQLTTNDAIYQQPAWSPAGDRIVVVRGAARAFQEASGPSAPGLADDLVWVSADGGDTTFIAPTDGRSNPHFTADPDRIYLHHAEKGLVSVRWDGTDEKAHLKVIGNKRPGFQEPNRARMVTMAPVGDQALAQVNHDLYVVTVPYVGGDTPSVSVARPDDAAFPVRKLTEIGGQFPAWSADGRKVHWSIGNAHFVYDLDAARAVEEEIRGAKEAEAKGGKHRTTSRKATRTTRVTSPTNHASRSWRRATSLPGSQYCAGHGSSRCAATKW